MIFFPFSAEKAEGPALADGGGGREGPSAKVQDGFVLLAEAFRAWLCQHELFVDCHSPHTHHTRTRVQTHTRACTRENGILVLILSLLSASGESGLFPDSTSGLLVAICKMQFENKKGESPTAFQAE